jgi:hypothetical protein
VVSLSYPALLDADVSFLPGSFTYWQQAGLFFFFFFLTDRWLAGCHVLGAMASPFQYTTLFPLFNKVRILFCTMVWYGCSARDICRDIYQDIYRVISWVIYGDI